MAAGNVRSDGGKSASVRNRMLCRMRCRATLSPFFCKAAIPVREDASLLTVAITLPLRHARELLGREINPTVYTSSEFDKKRATKDHFLTQVSAKPQLLVLGSADDLGKAAG